MEKKMIKILVLTNKQILISKIEEVGADVGEPDCKLIKPFLIKEPQLEGLSRTLEPFLMGVTKQDTFMMSSDKILTLADPTPTLLEKYEDLIKE
jgi:hypothetical protein